eukprot:14757731-Ditylum_brightwellii.AAC.1
MSLFNVKKYYHITMNTAMDDAFYMHLSNSDKIRIRSARKGMYVIDKHPELSSKDIWTKKMVDDDHPCPVFLETVKENKKLYPKRVYQRAIQARKLQSITKQGYRKMYDQVIEHLKNCPITKSDVVAAENIFKTNLGNLNCKTVRTMPKH